MDLAALRTLAEQATPGPWESEWTTQEGVALVSTVDKEPATVQAVCETGFDRPGANAEYIAAANPQVVLALVAAVEAAQELHDRVEMDESVGICLSERVPSLRLAAALAAFSEGSA